MNHKFEQLINEARDLRLTMREKVELKNKLEAFMLLHPVRQQSEYRLPLIEAEPRQSYWLGLSTLSMRLTVPVALVLFVIGGGVSWGAEGSLPGDLLYPVKTAVNEEIVSKLAPTSKIKAGWETKRAERRMIEAEKLAVAGKLDEETSLQMSEKLNSHVAKATDEIKTMAAQPAKAADASEAGTKLESKLRIHTQILTGLGEQTAAAAGEMANTAAVQVEAVAQVRADSTEQALNNDNKAKQAATEQRTIAEKSRKEIGELLASGKDYDAHVKEVAQAQLAKIEAEHASGNAKLTEGKFAEAFNNFQAAVRLAEEAKILLGLKQNLDIQILVVEEPSLDPEATTTPMLDASGASQASTSIEMMSLKVAPVPAPTQTTSTTTKATVKVKLGL